MIEKLRSRLGNRAGAPAVGIGDDAAVTGDEPGARVTSIDSFVEGVHFRRDTFSAEDLGHRSLAGALSDLAAMGADPLEAFTAIGLPRDLSERYVLEFYDGLSDLADRFGVVVAGGDTTRADQLFVTICVIGSLPSGRQPMLRSGAEPGDIVAVTGCLGGSAAGLALLCGRAHGRDLSASEKARLIDRHRRPSPRLKEGSALAHFGVSAAIDISDGVAGDALRLADASDIHVSIDLGDLPIDPAAAHVARELGVNPAEFAVAGGEEYELLATLPSASASSAQRLVGSIGLTSIGKIKEGEGATFHIDGVVRHGLRGYDHFR